MGDKADIPEVTDFSNDLQEAFADFRSQLNKVKESMEAINSMGSFSGKAPKKQKPILANYISRYWNFFKDCLMTLKETCSSTSRHLDLK